MKNSTRQNLAILGAATLAFAGTTDTEAAVLVSEDWQSPIVSNATQVDDTATFAGWDFTQGSGNVFKTRQHTSGGGFGPQDGLSPNQGIQFEWGNSYAAYDTTHGWTNDDVYQVTLNATEMSWSAASDRIVSIRIREATGDASLGALLYQADANLAEYDANHSGAGDSWSAAQFFTFDFDAGDFTGGTEGTALSFEVGSVDDATSNRGLSVDNITFTVVPEPSSLALLGLGGLLIARRRKG